MTLSQEDGKLFYELWLPLLDYVNQRYHINKNAGSMATSGRIDLAVVKEISDKLWSDVGILELYLKKHSKMPEDERNIIRGWKRRIRGKFVAERHLKKGTIFISMENNEVYQVSGIQSSWEEMLYGAPMPVLIETTFIPFRDVIISDGLIIPYNLKAEELFFEDEFDAVWACASLLHVARPDQVSALRMICRSLRKNGILYCSWKYGHQDRSDRGRSFTDFDEGELYRTLAYVPKLKLIKSWVTMDARPDRQEQKWLNALLRKAAE